MRSKVTLALLFLNVALFFYIFHARREWAVAQAAAADRERVLPREAANILSLSIAVGTEPPLHLERRGKNEGEWIITQPVEWPANPNAVRRILSDLQFLKHETSFPVAELAKNGRSLADYALDRPVLTLTFTAGADPSTPNAPAPAAFVLKIGALTAADNHLYILSPDGATIHVVDRSLADSLRLGLDQLRSDAIFTIPVVEVSALNLQAAATAARVRLRRDGARWTFEAPIIARASKPDTEKLLGLLNLLHVGRLLDDRAAPADRTGLATPVLRIEIEGNKRHETLLVGATVPPEPGAPVSPNAEVLRYARLEDRNQVFTLSFPAAFLDLLAHAQELLRETRFLDFTPAAVTALTLTAPGQPDLVLTRLDLSAASRPTAAEPKPASPTPTTATTSTTTEAVATDTWQIVRPGGAPPLPADRTLISHLLTRLTLLTATRFANDAPSAAELENLGFNRPERQITLSLAPAPDPAATSSTAKLPATKSSEPSTLTLQIGLGPRAETSARVLGQNFIYTVAPETLSGLPVAARFYRERLLRTLPEGAQITGLILTPTAPAEPAIYNHQLADGETWPQALASESPARRAALEALLTQLRTLRAKQFVTDAFTGTILVNGEARPWKYRLEVTLALTGGAAGAAQVSTSTLYLGERGAGGGTQLAGSPAAEFDVNFELDQPLIDALWTLTYGPRDPGPPAAASPTSPPSATSATPAGQL